MIDEEILKKLQSLFGNLRISRIKSWMLFSDQQRKLESIFCGL